MQLGQRLRERHLPPERRVVVLFGRERRRGRGGDRHLHRASGVGGVGDEGRGLVELVVVRGMHLGQQLRLAEEVPERPLRERPVHVGLALRELLALLGQRVPELRERSLRLLLLMGRWTLAIAWKGMEERS
jgi:hypothetical protein